MLRSLLFFTILAFGTRAQAKSKTSADYRLDQVWNAAVRYLRIDAKVKIIDKDEDAGFIIFEFTTDKRRYGGSMELIDRSQDAKRPRVTMSMHLEKHPLYMEKMHLDKLSRKLIEDYGRPVPSEPEPEPPKPSPKDDEVSAEKKSPQDTDKPS